MRRAAGGTNREFGIHSATDLRRYGVHGLTPDATELPPSPRAEYRRHPRSHRPGPHPSPSPRA